MIKAYYCIGIDLHKAMVQVYVLDKSGELSEEFRMRLDRAGADIGQIGHRWFSLAARSQQQQG